MRYEFINEIPEDLPPGKYNTRLVEVKYVKDEDGKTELLFRMEFLNEEIFPETPRENYGLLPLEKKTMREDAVSSGTLTEPYGPLGGSCNPTKPDDDCISQKKPSNMKLWFCPRHNEFHELPYATPEEKLLWDIFSGGEDTNGD
jgi:hypothetical protein